MNRYKPTRFVFLSTLAAVAVLAAAIGYYHLRTSAEFVEDYAVYAALSDAHADAAYLPAANNNPLRQELNRTLGQVLAGEMTDVERLALSKHGLELLRELEMQIDAIGEQGAKVSGAINELDDDGVLPASTMEEIITLAKERSEIIADIRGLSYRANYHTAEIFNRVISENGALTDAHIIALNKQLPKVEEQFDKRTHLYSQLQSTSQKITTAFASMSEE